MILVESDGNLPDTDICKFLVYAEEFDVVFGTRTSKSCIWTGSNMGFFLRYGNWAVAKLLEYLHNGPCLTDVGWTYRLLRREALRRIAPLFTVGESHFSPELMILAIRCGLACVEIPVHYQPRVRKLEDYRQLLEGGSLRAPHGRHNRRIPFPEAPLGRSWTC